MRAPPTSSCSSSTIVLRSLGCVWKAERRRGARRPVRRLVVCSNFYRTGYGWFDPIETVSNRRSFGFHRTRFLFKVGWKPGTWIGSRVVRSIHPGGFVVVVSPPTKHGKREAWKHVCVWTLCAGERTRNGGRESADGDVALAKVRQITARHVLDESGWSTGRLRYPHEDLPYVHAFVLERPAGVCLKTIRGRPHRANEAEPPYPRLGHAIHPYPVRVVVSTAHTTPRTTILSCATASRSPRPYPRPTSRAIPSCIGQHRLGYHPIETGRRTRSIRFRRQRDRKEAFSKGKFHPKLTSVPGSEAIRKTAPTSTRAPPWTPTDDSRCLERRGHA